MFRLLRGEKAVWEGEFPSLERRGGCAIKKMPRSLLSGRRRGGRSNHRLSEVEPTTPSAPSKERGYLFNGAATPPFQGGEFACSLGGEFTCKISPFKKVLYFAHFGALKAKRMRES